MKAGMGQPENLHQKVQKQKRNHKEHQKLPHLHKPTVRQGLKKICHSFFLLSNQLCTFLRNRTTIATTTV